MEIVSFNEKPIRIDLRLTRQFPYSRNFFQHLLDAGRIHIHAPHRETFVPKKSYKLQPGDEVQIDQLSRYLDGGILEECPTLPLDIRHETADYLVLYKPKGILSHPTSIREVQQPNMVGGVYQYVKKRGNGETLKYGHAEFIRAGLVHRLDKETDGLMIVAKTEEGLAYFKELFQRKSQASTKAEKEAVPLHKYYRATCHITPLGKQFLDQIGDNLPYYVEELVIPNVPHSIPKMGITKILTLRHPELAEGSPCGSNITIDLEILTGRTHQIRYHLAQHGLPIVGEYLYGDSVKTSKRQNDKTEAHTMLQLTAWKLVFVDNESTAINLTVSST